jgi:hypothetical protein
MSKSVSDTFPFPISWFSHFLFLVSYFPVHVTTGSQARAKVLDWKVEDRSVTGATFAFAKGVTAKPRASKD